MLIHQEKCQCCRYIFENCMKIFWELIEHPSYIAFWSVNKVETIRPKHWLSSHMQQKDISFSHTCTPSSHTCTLSPHTCALTTEVNFGQLYSVWNRNTWHDLLFVKYLPIIVNIQICVHSLSYVFIPKCDMWHLRMKVAWLTGY